jgi:hypothetical protein
MTAFNGPPRWLDTPQADGLVLPEDVRAELAAYAESGPGVESRARMLAGLTRELGLPESAAGQAQLGASGLPKVKILLSALGLLAGTLALLALWGPGREQTKSALAPAAANVAPVAAIQQVLPARDLMLAEPPALVESEPVLPSAPRERERVRARRGNAESAAARPARAASLPASTPRAAEDTSAMSTRSDPVAELALLNQARRALLSQPAHALEFTETHARDYPRGFFGEEREVLAIESLMRLGLTDEAKRRALAFEQRYPSSAHRAHLMRMIQTLDR